MRSLANLNPGERAYIVDMKNALLCEKLFEMGVFPGDLVVMEENSANDNSIVVRINDRRFNIFRQAAETIITHYIHFQYSLN